MTNWKTEDKAPLGREVEELFMRHFQVLFGSMVLLVCAATAQQTAPAPASGTSSDTSALEQKIRDLEDRLVMLEGQVRQLKAQGVPAPPPNAAAAATPSSAPPPQDHISTPQPP